MMEGDAILMSFMPIFQIADTVHLPMHPPEVNDDFSTVYVPLERTWMRVEISFDFGMLRK